ncbi:MAG: hypothetical protein J6P34_04655, partial [Paludibacteraceae bacterium]|nr:hypothetical protein [Paludibacteraceae bacterium]
MKRLSLLAVSMLLTCTLFAADIFLRGSVNSWGASDDFKFATSDDVVYTLEKSFDLFGEFKFADANWGADNYGSGGGAVELDTPLKLAPGGGNFNCGSNSYKVTKIVLNLLENSATIYGEGGELEITSWTVCGSAAVMGTEFDPTDTSNDMEFVGGVYQLQKKSVALAADAIYEYKFTGNHAWGVGQYPESMDNLEFTVPADGTYNVTFSWNPATQEYGVVPTSVTPPIEFDSYIVVGDAALFYVDWTPSPIGVEYFTLETTDGIHYTKTVENVPIKTAGTFAYGFSKNGSTTEILFADKSQTVTVDEAGAYNIAVSLTVAPGEEPKAEAILTKVDPGTTYYIAGNGADFAPDVDWCCGENWNEKGCPMESGFFTRDLPAGAYLFKITDGTWDNSWGYDAVDATQSTAGYYDAGDNNIGIKLSAELSTVGVKFDGSKIVLEWTAKDTPVPPITEGITVNVTVPEGTPACFFYGEMSDNKFVEMTMVDATHYTTKFEGATSIGWGYLFCYEADNWDTKSAGGDITVEPVDGVINVEITWINQPSVPDVWSVVGDAALGLVWTPEKTTDDMQFVGGAYQLVKTGLVLEAGDYEYKFAANHQWGKEYPASGNLTLNIPENGTYKVTFSLNATGTEGSAVAEKEVDPGFDSWTLVGDMPPFPAAWTILNGFDLQTTDGVVYELHEQTEFTVTEFEYGFRKNHDNSSYAPLAEKYTATLAEGTGEYKVDIKVDFTDATAPDVKVEFTKVPKPVYDYYIAGNGDGLNGWTCGITWDPAGCGMAEGQYKAHVQPGTYEFKVTNGTWDTTWGIESVDAIKSTPGYEGTDNIKFTVNAEANITVSFDGTSIILLSDVPFGEATITSWTAVGEAGLFENAWTPTDESNDMQFVGGVYQLVKTGLTLEAKDYLYKFTANHQWSVAEIPSGNATLTIEEAGTYKVTFSLNPATGEYSAVPEKEVDPGYDTWTLVGDMPPFPVAWTAIAAFDLKTTDGIVYTLSADDVDMPVAEFQYGFRKNHTEEYAPLDEKYTATLTEGTGKYSVDVKLDFTVAADPTVEVIFTKKPEPIVKGITVNVTVPEGTPACFFYGDMSGNTFVEMTKVDDTHYTTKFEDKESIGWGYTFCWEANNWSTQNVEGDFTVEPVDGVINIEVSGWLTNPGVEYHYTTYTHWEIMTDWDGGDWTWQSLEKESDGVFSAVAPWGTGTGVNLGSDGNPIKKNWYPAGDTYLTIQDGLNAGQAVKVTLTVIDDETVKIDVVDANPTSADEAVEDSIYATNGTVFCSTPFEVYNLVGQNVTAQNGSLFG